MSKLVSSLREAVAASGLRDGMTVSFHHHLRSGDYVINMVMNEIAAMGIKNLTVNASSLFDVHAPLAEHIKSGVITRIITDYMSEGLGKYIRGNNGAAGGVYDPRRAAYGDYAGKNPH